MYEKYTQKIYQVLILYNLFVKYVTRTLHEYINVFKILKIPNRKLNTVYMKLCNIWDIKVCKQMKIHV